MNVAERTSMVPLRFFISTEKESDKMLANAAQRPGVAVGALVGATAAVARAVARGVALAERVGAAVTADVGVALGASVAVAIGVGGCEQRHRVAPSAHIGHQRRALGGAALTLLL